jgi:hypothetical protein
MIELFPIVIIEIYADEARLAELQILVGILNFSDQFLLFLFTKLINHANLKVEQATRYIGY